MWGRAPWITTAIMAMVAGLVVVAAAEPAHQYLCAHRDDRPELGSPVHFKRGGGGLQSRLPNGHHVRVLSHRKGWYRIYYNDPSVAGRVRSEPLHFTGWIRERYLKACPPAPAPPQSDRESP